MHPSRTHFGQIHHFFTLIVFPELYSDKAGQHFWLWFGVPGFLKHSFVIKIAIFRLLHTICANDVMQLAACSFTLTSHLQSSSAPASSPSHASIHHHPFLPTLTSISFYRRHFLFLPPGALPAHERKGQVASARQHSLRIHCKFPDSGNFF